MAFTCPPEFLALAHRLADRARPIARHYFRSANLAIESKTLHDPVTLADREIEEQWREMILAERPDDAIWGEEYGRTNPDSEWTWIFDPIDGTKSFSIGYPIFGCMIGLHHRVHGFVLGLVDQPVLDLRWTGITGQGAYLNKTPIIAAPFTALADIRMSITNPIRLPPAMQKLHDALKPQVNFIHYGGNVMNYTGVADGSIHATIESSQQVFDIAAIIPIIREAGGVITEIDGSAIDLVADHAVLAASTPDLHAALLAEYRTCA